MFTFTLNDGSLRTNGTMGISDWDEFLSEKMMSEFIEKRWRDQSEFACFQCRKYLACIDTEKYGDYEIIGCNNNSATHTP